VATGGRDDRAETMVRTPDVWGWGSTSDDSVPPAPRPDGRPKISAMGGAPGPGAAAISHTQQVTTFKGTETRGLLDTPSTVLQHAVGVHAPVSRVRAYFAGLPQGGVGNDMVNCKWCRAPWAATRPLPGAFRFGCPQCAAHWVPWRVALPAPAAPAPPVGDVAWFDNQDLTWAARDVVSPRHRLCIYWRERVVVEVDACIALAIRDQLSQWEGTNTEAAAVVGTAWWCLSRLGAGTQCGVRVRVIAGMCRVEPIECELVYDHKYSEESHGARGAAGARHLLDNHGVSEKRTPMGADGGDAHTTAPGVSAKVRAKIERHAALARQVEVTRSAVATWLQARCATNEGVGDMVSRMCTVVEPGWCPWPVGQPVGCPVWDAPIWPHYLERDSVHQPMSPYRPVFTSAAADMVAKATTLLPQGFAKVFAGHPQEQWLCNGARYGFPLLSSLKPCRMEFPQHPLSTAHLKAVDEWVEKQLECGKMCDITDVAARLDALFVSPFQTDEKADGSIRTCHNAAAGGDQSLNQSIDNTASEPVDLATIHLIITRLRELEAMGTTEVVAARVDLKAWFRQIGIRPSERWRMGQKLGSRTFAHNVFTFGVRSAGHTACGVSNAILDVLCRDGTHWAAVYNDDFIFIGTRAQVEAAVAALRAILAQLGVTENTDKFIPPSEVMDVLGHEVDIRNMLVQITAARRDRVVAVVSELLHRHPRVASVRELREIAGVLAFVGTTVPLARAYTAGLWSLTGDSTQPGCTQRSLGSYAVTGLQWWLEFLRRERFQVGRIDAGIKGAPVVVTTGCRSDASGSWGFGGLSTSHGVYVQGPWGDDERAWSIAVKEGVAAFLLMAVLAPQLTSQVVVLQTDNLSVAYMLLTLTATDPQLRLLSLWFAALQEKFRFIILPSHVATKHNDSDALSRGHDPRLCLPSSITGTWRGVPIPSSLRSLGSLGAARLREVLSPALRSHGRPSTTTIDLSMPGDWDCSALERLAQVPMPFVPQVAWELRLRELAHEPVPSPL